MYKTENGISVEDGKVIAVDCVLCGRPMVQKQGYWECRTDFLSTNPDIPDAYCEHVFAGDGGRCRKCGGFLEREKGEK